MEETYRTHGIVLRREPYRENDSRVTVYTRDLGKQTLVARGARKLKSKLAAHLEPLCLSELMVVRGRGHDYLGSAISQSCFKNLKNNLDKLSAAAGAARIINRLTKDSLPDSTVYDLTEALLTELDKPGLNFPPELLADFFLIKYISLLGYRPSLDSCAVCGSKLKPGGNKFELAKNSTVHNGCLASGRFLSITDDGVKVLRLALESDLSRLTKLKINDKLQAEIKKIVETIVEYHFE